MIDAWDRAARGAAASYRSHPDYDDLLAVARLAAWEDQAHPYRAATDAIIDFLRGPMNRTRTYTRWSRHANNPLPVAVPLEDEAVGTLIDGSNPERETVGRLWVEWLIQQPCLSPNEREVLSLWVMEGHSLTEICRMRGRSNGWAWEIYNAARRKLARVHSGEYLPRCDLPRWQPPPPEDIERIHALRRQGMSLRQIAETTGYSYPAVQRHARSIG